jgi:hypothetical protein
VVVVVVVAVEVVGAVFDVVVLVIISGTAMALISTDAAKLAPFRACIVALTASLIVASVISEAVSASFVLSTATMSVRTEIM